MMMQRFSPCKYIALLFLVASPLLADDYKIIDGDSIMAVVVKKGGVLARLAHNHFVYATNYNAALSCQDNNAETLHFNLNFATEDLNNDLIEVSSRWYPRINQANILAEPFVKLSDDDRKSIRHTMLSAQQLEANKFPAIKVTLLSVRRQPTARSTHLATIIMSIHGHDVTKEVPLNIQFGNDTIEVEGTAPFLFTDFGIEPYKALAGALRNENMFYIYTSIKAVKKV